MKRKYFSTLLMGALAIASTSMVTSCKDYDDDIQNLQQQIDANKSAIEEISKLIKEGSVITSVEKATSGVTVKLSNGDTFTINNGEKGADGTPGTAWTIGDDGYWVKDGVKTQYYALGTKGEKGDKGDKGDKGEKGDKGDTGAAGSDGTSSSYEYYVPNAETGYFDIWKDGKFVKSTNISFLGSGVITAVKDNETLKLYGVTGGTGQNKEVTISLSGSLSSLTYRPYLYLDGIETVEYPWLAGNAMKTTAATADVNHNGKTVKNVGNDYVTNAAAKFVYGPAWAVDYDASPWNSIISEEDLAGYNVLNPTAIYQKTRAAVSDLGSVTSPAYAYPGKDKGGKKLFAMDNATGVLTAGLQIQNPDKLNATPTSLTSNDNNTVALRVKNNEGKEIVSDYALVQPEKTLIDGMVWAQNPEYPNADKDAVRTGDEACKYSSVKKHVWDEPIEALKDQRGASLSIYYDDPNGIDLNEYVAVRLVKTVNVKKGTTNELITLTPEEAKQWGLTFHYKKVMYTVDTNTTSDSEFLKALNADDDTNGKFRAWNVKVDEPIKGAEGDKASVGREPLVQVTVTNNKNEVVLDGYILLYISAQAKDNHKNELWSAQTTQFNPCDVNEVFKTTWQEFNDYVLTQDMKMSKDDFDHQYVADLTSSTEYGEAGSGVYLMKQFADFAQKGEGAVNENPVGRVLYRPNTDGTTNHTWRWEIDQDEIEKLLHHKETVTLTTWVRYKAKDKVSAAYPYVYIKLTATINNKKTNTYAFGDKNNNYWYNDGQVVVFDVVNPYNGGNINTINRSVRSTLVKNKESFDAPMHKYYFVPKTVEITAQNGTKYTITPKSTTEQPNFDKLICKYVQTPVADKHEYSTLATTLKTCALDIDEGAFTNTNLYAVAGATTTKIASINPETGEIKLINNKACQDILNAVGYEPNHGGNLKQMRAWVGIATANHCGVVENTTNDQFIASWQRPINLKDIDNNVMVDANTNGNIINVIDFLKLYDWRGETAGFMWGANTWFWAYYGINSITVDADPAHVLTNMHNGNKFVPLKDITTEAELYALEANNNGVKTALKYTFDLSSYNSSDKNADLLTYMKSHAADFGRLYYTNNGDNVKAFDIIVPITIGYTWGSFETNVKIHIEATAGNVSK